MVCLTVEDIDNKWSPRTADPAVFRPGVDARQSIWMSALKLQPHFVGRLKAQLFIQLPAFVTGM